MPEFISAASGLSHAEALLRVLVAALAGGLIGVERERTHGRGGGQAFGGARTFPLVTILGASLTVASGEIGAATVAGFLGLAALVVASYLRTSRTDAGATTEVAALAAYWIGVLAGAGALVLAGAVAVGTAVLLASKERLARFSRTLTREELSAVLTLAVLAAVVLPVLPDRDLGPWGVWNPRELWLVVVFVCGLSFAAFVAMRILGASRGLYLSGLLGGLVSSTAATVTFANRSREAEGQGNALAIGAGLASLVMLLRVALLTFLAGGASILLALAPVLTVMIIAAMLPILLLARRKDGTERELELSNPFRLASALKFALLYAVVLLVVEAAKQWYGSAGLTVAAILAGLSDVDAVTLAFARSRQMAEGAAAGGIALAALANTLAKAGYALALGRGTFRRGMAVILGASFLAGAVTLGLIGPRP